MNFPLSNFAIEVALVGIVVALGASGKYDVASPGGVRVKDLATLYVLAFAMRHGYNAYLEWAYAAYPAWRTQKDAKPREERDDMGRTEEEIALIEWHDRLTALATFGLFLGSYWLLPGLYPAVARPKVGGWAAQPSAGSSTRSSPAPRCPTTSSAPSSPPRRRSGWRRSAPARCSCSGPSGARSTPNGAKAICRRTCTASSRRT